MRAVATGVIGHVDHGKTALVRALTGTDTDRLPEEKTRGISIVPGYARLEVPAGEIHFIDLPGHERFVRAMVAGATGIGTVLVAVDAAEGVKPQTVEHVEIAALLGVRRGVIAVTRCDLAAPEAAAATASAARRLAAEAGIGDLPAVPTSATTGAGLDDLAAALAEMAAAAAMPAETGLFHLPVDRVFAVAGFGTVVTGTLRRGALATGEEVELLPSGRRARVRSLQSHGRTVDRASPGARTAVNLRGVGQDDIGRGTVLATPGCLVPSLWLDVRLTLLPGTGAALANGATVRVLAGTAEVGARVRLLDREALAPGAAAIAQLRCDADLAVPAREPFILRTASPARTIGGGTVIDPASRRRRRFDADLCELLRATTDAAPAEVAARRLGAAGAAGIAAGDLARLLALPPARLPPLLDRVGAVDVAGTVLLRDSCGRLEEAVAAHLAEFQRRQPAEPGLSPARLRAAVAPSMSDSAFDAVVAGMVARGRLARDGGIVRRPDLDPLAAMPARDRALVAAVERTFRRAGLTPPDLKDVVGQDRRRLGAVKLLLRLGVLVRTVDRVQDRQIVFHRDAVHDAARRLRRDLASRADGFLAGEAGRTLGITRKYGIPLLEHLDSAGVTRRTGDRRVVVQESGTGAPPARSA